MSHCFRFFLFASLLACGPLLTPADRFHMEVISVTPRQLIQSVENVDVEFKLPGDCENLRISVPIDDVVYGHYSVMNGGITVPHEKKGKDTYVAHIPTKVLTGQTYTCDADEKKPKDIRFGLEAYCYSSASRARASWPEIGTIEYGVAWRNISVGPVQVISATGDADTFVSLGKSTLSSTKIAPLAKMKTDAPIESGVTPLLVERGGVVSVWGGCPFAQNGCGRSNPVTLERPDGTVAGTFDLGATYVYVSKLEPEGIKSLTTPLVVPGGISAMGIDAFSNKTVLLNGATAPAIVTHIDEKFVVSSRAFEGERVITRFSKLANGQLAFVTQIHASPNSARLRKSDGTVVTDFSVPGDGLVKLMSIAPSSDETPILAMVRGDKFWLRSSRGEWKSVASNFVGQVDTKPSADSDSLPWGISWLSTAVALWSKDGVEVFDFNASLRYRYSRPLTAYEKEDHLGEGLDPEPVFGVLGVGDKAVVTFDREVHLLDKAGHLKSGAMPVPCMSTGATAALAGERAAVSAGDRVLIFDLSRY